jgi:proteasome lid subunit RPN8/RPN11
VRVVRSLFSTHDHWIPADITQDKMMGLFPDPNNGITDIQMDMQHWETMKSHVISCLPEEACGLLGGVGSQVNEVFPVTNELHSPSRFRMDPEEQLAAMMRMEEQGFQMVGIFHSHVCSLSNPSETDIEEATYPEVAYLIWSMIGDDWQCRAFRLLNERTVEISIKIDGE